MAADLRSLLNLLAWIDQTHDFLKCKIHHKHHAGYDKRGCENQHSTTRQLLACGPRNFVCQLIVAHFAVVEE